MLVNAASLGIAHLHMKWVNPRYERSRRLIIAATAGLAIQYLAQMLLGFRAQDDATGAVVNVLFYPPCFSLIAMGIHNIVATHANLRKMSLVCAGIYAVILAVFAIGYYSEGGNLRIGNWIYVLLLLFEASVAYCLYMVIVEMRKRRKMLETMAGNDILPYVRYARTSVFILFFAALVMPFAVLSTTFLYVVGPLGLLATLFFNISFMALGYFYVPTDELLDKEEEKNTAGEDVDAKGKEHSADGIDGRKTASATGDEEKEVLQLPAECEAFIRGRLEAWCASMGYKDTSLNMLTLSRSLCISKSELSRYFTSCLGSNFRIWLSEVRFEAAKKMMRENPDYSNDIISAECGFSSRSYLYRIFKEKEDCSPTAWRSKIGKKHS